MPITRQPSETLLNDTDSHLAHLVYAAEVDIALNHMVELVASEDERVLDVEPMRLWHPDFRYSKKIVNGAASHDLDDHSWALVRRALVHERDTLADRQWYLNPEWSPRIEQGGISEQVNLQLTQDRGDGVQATDIDIFNFGPRMDLDVVDRAASLFHAFIRERSIDILRLVPSFAIHPDWYLPRGAYMAKNEKVAGMLQTKYGLITLAQSGAGPDETVNYTRGGRRMPKFEAILLHELGHALDYMIEDDSGSRLSNTAASLSNEDIIMKAKRKPTRPYSRDSPKEYRADMESIFHILPGCVPAKIKPHLKGLGLSAESCTVVVDVRSGLDITLPSAPINPYYTIGRPLS